MQIHLFFTSQKRDQKKKGRKSADQPTRSHGRAKTVALLDLSP
jgi:hypothetical protein